MRLEPTEVPALPLPAALVDLDGREVSQTPEWAGRCPGTVSFHAGQGYLLVAPDASTPELDILMERLLQELQAAAAGVGGDEGMRMAVLTAGLELVAGRPVAGGPQGTVEDVLALALAAIRVRAQGLGVQIVGPLPRTPAPAPAAIALALVQLAVNAQRHEGARRVALRVAAGPTFVVEWPAPARASSPVSTHRHLLRRAGWGWGYVQMVADALGAAALPPGPSGPATTGACLSLGAPRLGLPIAAIRDGRVERATQAWDQDQQRPGFGQPLDGLLAQLAAAAEGCPGRIVYRDLYRARQDRGRTWVVLPPESGASRARDVLSGLQHERALWTAPEPHATRAMALATLLQVAMGEPWPNVPPGVFAEVLPAACARLGIATPEPVDAVVLPEPRATAFLLAELDGRLVAREEEVWLAASRAASGSPLLQALGGLPGGWLRISG
jgi:hypothetical protein